MSQVEENPTDYNSLIKTYQANIEAAKNKFLQQIRQEIQNSNVEQLRNSPDPEGKRQWEIKLAEWKGQLTELYYDIYHETKDAFPSVLKNRLDNLKNQQREEVENALSSQSQPSPHYDIDDHYQERIDNANSEFDDSMGRLGSLDLRNSRDITGLEELIFNSSEPQVEENPTEYDDVLTRYIECIELAERRFPGELRQRLSDTNPGDRDSYMQEFNTDSNSEALSSEECRELKEKLAEIYSDLYEKAIDQLNHVRLNRMQKLSQSDKINYSDLEYMEGEYKNLVTSFTTFYEEKINKLHDTLGKMLGEHRRPSDVNNNHPNYGSLDL